jgi:hypothetical protein
MSDAVVSTEALAAIELIAGAIRDELGEEIDAYPGFRAPENADPFNRAFRAVVRAILAVSGASKETLPALVSQSLRRVAERRLAADGYDGGQARYLLDEEPGSPDDWLAFLILSSRAQIEPLLKPDDPHLA